MIIIVYYSGIPVLKIVINNERTKQKNNKFYESVTRVWKDRYKLMNI